MLDKLRREREALEASYADVDAEVGEMHERWKAGDLPPEAAVVDFAKLVGILSNYLTVEREQAGTLFALLLDAYASVVEAYED